MNKPILIGLSFGLFLLQSAILPFIFNGSSQPDLWLVSIIIVAMIFKFDFAIIFALIAGFIQDLVISNFFGLHIFPYLIIAYFFAKYGKERYNKHWYVSAVAVIAGSLIYLICETGILYLAGIKIISSLNLLEFGVVFVVYNTICSLLLHRILWSFKFEKEIYW